MAGNAANNSERDKKQNRISRILSNILLVVCILVFLYSGYQLFTIFADYREGELEYDQIKESVIIQAPLTVEEEEEQEPVFQVDFEKLLAINDDVVGWIRFDEPAQISYPIAHGVSNDQYLRTTLEGKKNTAGTIFVDYQNEGDFSDRNTFVYGHNMRNGTMFGQLKKYEDQDFYEKYPYFYIYTLDGRVITYQIFAVAVVLDTSDSYDMSYTDAKDFEEYINYIRSKTLFDTDVEVSADSKIVSLSTCWRGTDDKRLLVHGVAISESMIEE